MPATLVTGVWGLPPLALLMLVPLLALAVPGAAQETWTATSTTNAPAGRYNHTAVWTGSRMIVWGGWNDTGAVNTGGVYDPATDTWTATSTTNAPFARGYHTAIWTGSKMIVWGGAAEGDTNTGGVYDPATDTWTTTSTMNAPSARYSHTAVWTGSKMIIWGGADLHAPLGNVVNTGGVYDPATDSWTATSTMNAPSARYSHTAVWTGSKMIVWGGSPVPLPAWVQVNTGGVYDPAADTWTATSTTNAPAGRDNHTAVWTGSRMIVWGGSSGGGDVSTGGVYDPATDTWAATSTMNAPSAHFPHTAVWTGSRMVVWAWDANSGGVTGGAYDPATDTWTATSTTNAPAGRYNHTAVWTGSRMIVWGGWNDTGAVNTGGVYSNPAVLPSPPPPADFYTVTPCRLVDTRNAAGPTGGPALVAGAVRSFPVTGGACGIPATAMAVSVNLTVTQPAAQGHLILYPGDAAGPPLVSNVNFTPGATRANNAVVLLAANGGTINVKNGSGGSVHLVLDVNGYFQ